MAKYRISRITGDEFTSLKDHWDNLLKRSAAATVFLTWEWLHTWWRHYSEGKTLFTLTVRDDWGRLVGIAPLCIRDERFGAIQLRVLSFLGSEEVCSDYLDFILDRDEREEVAEEVFSYINSQKDLWDCVVLSDILEDSSTRSSLIGFLDCSGTSYTETSGSDCPYLPLPGDYEDYIQGLSKSMRYSLRRRAKIFSERFDSSFEKLRTQDEIDDAMSEVFDLHRSRREMIGTEGSFLKDRLVDFHRDVASELAKEGHVRIYRLRVRDTPVSILYGFRYNGKYYYYQSGMNPDFNRFSVGQVLMAYCIKDSIESNVDEFDFLRGPEPYKYKWTGSTRKTVNIVFAPSGLKGKAFMTALALKNKASRAKGMVR